LRRAIWLLSPRHWRGTSLATGLITWFKDLNNWLIIRPTALPEGQVKNNHGTFYDTQAVDFALFTGDDALAKRTL
jgi:hypothetical protein